MVGHKLFVVATTDFEGTELFFHDLLAGTTGNDEFVLRYSTAIEGKVTVTRTSGVAAAETVGIFPYTLPLKIDGLSGTDTLRIETSAAADVIEISSLSKRINGANLQPQNFEARRSLVEPVTTSTPSWRTSAVWLHWKNIPIQS